MILIISFFVVFGICGAYLRYLLSQLNPFFPKFPIGTFIANTLGTWLYAMFLTLSKFYVNYYNIDIQSILFGLNYGFCGCLTTVSTFVNEIKSLSETDAYIYSLTTHITAQAGIILIFNIYAYTSAPSSSITLPIIELCSVSEELCNELFDSINCPENQRINIGCQESSDYTTYQGLCICGEFNTNRVSEIIIDSQIKYSMTSSLINVWPKNPNKIIEPTEVFDLCLTYENACVRYLDRIGCPEELRSITSCLKK